MILIGQYDSPFVRRVAIALGLYGLAYDHRPWSTFGDADKIAAYNPLLRVPTLVLEDGSVLIDSAAILDHLDDLVGPDRAMIAKSGPARREGLRVCALVCGAADKAVSLLYERVLRERASDIWVERCRRQVGAVFSQLESERAQSASGFWQGEGIGHADIAVTAVVKFIRDAHPGLLAEEALPHLAALAGRCEEMEVFRQIQQPLTTPAT